MEDVAGATIVSAIVKRRRVGFTTGFFSSFDHRLRSASLKQGKRSLGRGRRVKNGSR